MAGAVFAGQGGYLRMVDWVESDLRVRLRGMRMPVVYLRRWLHVWIAGIVVLFFALGMLLDNFVLGALTAMFLSAGPWYVIRRLAEARHQKN